MGRVEDQLRKTEELLARSQAQDASHGARRIYATIVGLPLGIAAFLYIGVYWNASNGTGVYVGITCAFILWLIARHILGLPETETPTILQQFEKLKKERVRVQESLRKHAEESGASEPEPASQDEDAAAS